MKKSSNIPTIVCRALECLMAKGWKDAIQISSPLNTGFGGQRLANGARFTRNGAIMRVSLAGPAAEPNRWDG